MHETASHRGPWCSPLVVLFLLAPRRLPFLLPQCQWCWNEKRHRSPGRIYSSWLLTTHSANHGAAATPGTRVIVTVDNGSVAIKWHYSWPRVFKESFGSLASVSRYLTKANFAATVRLDVTKFDRIWRGNRGSLRNSAHVMADRRGGERRERRGGPLQTPEDTHLHSSAPAWFASSPGRGRTAPLFAVLIWTTVSSVIATHPPTQVSVMDRASEKMRTSQAFLCCGCSAAENLCWGADKQRFIFAACRELGSGIFPQHTSMLIPMNCRCQQTTKW